jgi:hypothetical protein
MYRPRMSVRAKPAASVWLVGITIISPIVMMMTAATNIQYADTTPNMANPTR